MIDIERLNSLAGRYCGTADARACALLAAYAEAVLEKNEVMNLTAITEPRAFEDKHLLDSLACAASGAVRGQVCDVGTGAGFPGVALKIAKPEIDITLVDATAKKLVFIEECCAKLGIEGVFCVHGRAEELGRSASFRESFDCVCGRAVAHLAALCELCLPLVCVGGNMIAMKGPDAESEVALAARAISQLGGKVSDISRYDLPDGDRRALIIIEKIAQTPPQYPRSGKNIIKSPIINDI
ncbi:MAG: 16S rRNA (guanine(527)-N(7))-methyltransferase RsmG [Oscillospiraceae bacterium]